MTDRLPELERFADEQQFEIDKVVTFLTEHGIEKQSGETDIDALLRRITELEESR